MKLKKLILMVPMLLLFSGCSNIKYSLKFNKPIAEYMTIHDSSHNDEILPDGYMADLSPIEYLFQSLPYNSGSDGNGNYYAGTFYDDPMSIYDSVIFRYISSDSVKINNKKISINISKEDLINIDNVNGLEVSLYIPYYVSKNNADKVSKNIYTWIIDDLEKDTIKINFDLSKPADFMKKIISYCIIGVLVIGIICVIIYFVNVNKKANEI